MSGRIVERLVDTAARKKPTHKLAKEMTHDPGFNVNKDASVRHDRVQNSHNGANRGVADFTGFREGLPKS